MSGRGIPTADELVRMLWRLPAWGPLTTSLRTARKVLRMPSPPPPPVPIPDPAPLEALLRDAPAGLRAGAVSIDITPPRPVGMYLAGFGNGRTCTGVRDPIFARVLVLAEGRHPLVIIALDLVGLSLVRVERLRRRLTRRHAASVVIACTHNHQSPDTLGLWGPSLAGLIPFRTGLDPGYMLWLEDRIVQGARLAIGAARPAVLHLAQSRFDSRGRWIRNERGPVVDRDLRLMQIDDERGGSIATLIQHACHPETLWKSNRSISSDFCGACCRFVEERIGGTALYVNGALGAMVTATLDRDSPAGARERFLEALGGALGQRAVRLVARARTKPAQSPVLRSARAEVAFPVEDNRFYALVHALGVVDPRELDRGLVSEVSCHLVGPATITAVPGEASPELGLEILERVTGHPRFLFGLAGDELGYLLPPDCFHDRAYAYPATMSPGPQAAARLSLAVEGLMPELQRGGGVDG